MMSNITVLVSQEKFIWYELSAKCVFPQMQREAWRKIDIPYLHQGHRPHFLPQPVFLDFMLFGKKDSVFLQCSYVKPWSFGIIQWNKTLVYLFFSEFIEIGFTVHLPQRFKKIRNSCWALSQQELTQAPQSFSFCEDSLSCYNSGESNKIFHSLKMENFKYQYF